MMQTYKIRYYDQCEQLISTEMLSVESESDLENHIEAATHKDKNIKSVGKERLS